MSVLQCSTIFSLQIEIFKKPETAFFKIFIFFKRKSKEIELQVTVTNLVARYAKGTFCQSVSDLVTNTKMKDLGAQSITALILTFIMNSMTFRIWVEHRGTLCTRNKHICNLFIDVRKETWSKHVERNRMALFLMNKVQFIYWYIMTYSLLLQ